MHQPVIGEKVILVVNDPDDGSAHRYDGVVLLVRDGGALDIEVEEVANTFAEVLHSGHETMPDTYYEFPEDVEAADAAADAANPAQDAYPASTEIVQPHMLIAVADRPDLPPDQFAVWGAGFDAGWCARGGGFESQATDTIKMLGDQVLALQAENDALKGPAAVTTDTTAVAAEPAPVAPVAVTATAPVQASAPTPVAAEVAAAPPQPAAPAPVAVVAPEPAPAPAAAPVVAPAAPPSVEGQPAPQPAAAPAAPTEPAA